MTGGRTDDGQKQRKKANNNRNGDNDRGAGICHKWGGGGCLLVRWGALAKDHAPRGTHGGDNLPAFLQARVVQTFA